MSSYCEANSTRNPQKRSGKVEGRSGKKSLFFFLADKKKRSVAEKCCSLTEDGVYSVIASFEEF